MQIAGTPTADVASGGVTVIGPSLALDLTWAVHSTWSPALRDAHPVLERSAAEHPELGERMRSFWGEGPHCIPEFDVLAHHGGALAATDLDGLFEKVGSATATIAGDLRLASESEEERATILGRIDQLRSSRSLRAEYFTLLGDLWAPIDEWWRAEGVPLATWSAREARHDLERGTSWQQLVKGGCDLVVELIPQMIEFQQAGQSVAVVVCALFGRMLYLDLPGCVVIGLGAGRSDHASRTRTEHVARRIRVLADPTRLAILDHLTHGPCSVGELAKAFGLAQPTVSAHVKQLREANLVAAERRGARLELSVEREAVNELARELTGLVAG